jgi:hypothetical protein
MQKFRFTILALLVFAACKQRLSLTEQLKNNFSVHLKRIDSTVSFDSLHIIWSVRANQRLGRIIDDSVYVREYDRIQFQLANAKSKGNHDSILFYDYERDFMKKEIDSITQSIQTADTENSFGRLIGCIYYISKGSQTLLDSTPIFLDSTYTLRFSEFMDSSLSRAIKKFH